YAAISGRLSHADLSHYNAPQKLLYLGVLITGMIIVVSGLAIWKPVQFHALAALLGGYEGARLVHFFAMTTIVLFLAIHVVMALLVPRSLRAIILGRYRRTTCVKGVAAPPSTAISSSRTPPTGCPTRPAAFFCATPSAWGRWHCSPAATSPTAGRRRRSCAKSPNSTTGCRPDCSTPTNWRRPTPIAP